MKTWTATFSFLIASIAYWQIISAPASEGQEPVATSIQCPLWADNTSPVLFVDLGVHETLGRPSVMLQIPESYILPRNLARYRNGQLDGAALVYAKLPDFGPQSPQINVDPTSDEAEHTARILISTHVDMQTILASKIDIWGRPAEGVSFPRVQASAGLMEVDYPIFGTPAFETFFAQDPGEITDVIVCDNRAEAAQCRHQFDAGAVEVTVSYRRSNLAQWAQIRSSAQVLLDCFTGLDIITDKQNQ